MGGVGEMKVFLDTNVVTRDVKGFEKMPIRVMTPAAFLESVSY